MDKVVGTEFIMTESNGDYSADHRHENERRQGLETWDVLSDANGPVHLRRSKSVRTTLIRLSLLPRGKVNIRYKYSLLVSNEGSLEPSGCVRRWTTME